MMGCAVQFAMLALSGGAGSRSRCPPSLPEYSSQPGSFVDKCGADRCGAVAYR